MEIAFWNDLSDLTRAKVKRLRIMAQGMCLSCNRPVPNKKFLCQNCSYYLRVSGLERGRVRYGAVGLNTINYQQHLHRKMFNCNAPYDYRGLKDERIKCNITQKSIDLAANKLAHYLSRKGTLSQRKLYSAIKDLRNTNRRLLYAMILYGISYFILDNKEFKHLCHFQASICRQLDNDVKRMYIRTTRDVKSAKSDMGSRSQGQMLEQYNAIISAIEPILVQLVSE